VLDEEDISKRQALFLAFPLKVCILYIEANQKHLRSIWLEKSHVDVDCKALDQKITLITAIEAF